MINRLWGSIRDAGDKRIFLQTSFIEWEIIIGEKCKSFLFQQDAAKLAVYTYLLHREDAMLLYGFSSIFVRETFLAVQKVSGIGAKQALNIVSSLDPVYFWEGIQKQDIGSLVSVPGLGKKRAEQALVSLKDKVPELPAQGVQKQVTSDIILGLVQMGYRYEEIQEAYAQLEEHTREESEAVIFSELVRILGGGV